MPRGTITSAIWKTTERPCRTILAPIFSGIALTDAGRHCAEQGRQVLVSNIASGRSAHLPGGTVEVTFQRLRPDDPALRRPSFRPTPDLVIEHR
jgi:hypothetical protein